MNIAKKLVDALKSKQKPSGYDTTATVNRIEGDTAWVSIAGGVDETPVKISIDAKPGDNVNVRVAGGKAWITGNNTAPPTDDKTAKAAMNATKKTSKSLKTIEEKIENGDFDGKDGTSVTSVTAQYCLANANTIPAGQTFDDIQYSAWQDTIPEYVEGKYYWMRLKICYSDGTIGYNAPIFDLGTQASTEADIAAQAAEDAAEDAAEIAQQALTGVGTIENHFWADSSGVHVSENDGTVATGSSQTIASNGTVIMRNGKLITSWTGSSSSNAAINFYDCTSDTARAADLIASYGRAGITQYINNIVAMALTASGLSFYTPDANHNLQAVFGSTGVELYASGVKRMAVTSTGMVFYASDGTTKMAEYSSDGLSIYGGNTSGVELAHFGYNYGKDSTGSTANKVIYSNVGIRKANTVIGGYSVAEGYDATASGFCAHAEGETPTASGNNSHAEGYYTKATGSDSHAEGNFTTASGNNSHAEGYNTTASGNYSHAEGYYTEASGNYSHAGGLNTNATGNYQTVFGKYNVADQSALFQVGDGTGPSAKSNGLSLSQAGDLRVRGKMYANCSNNSTGGINLLMATHETTKASKSVAHNTRTVLTNFTIPKGTWVITVKVAFEANATGRRGMWVSKNNGTASGDDDLSGLFIGDRRDPPSAGGAVLETTFHADVTSASGQTYYLKVYQSNTSSANLTVQGIVNYTGQGQ